MARSKATQATRASGDVAPRSLTVTVQYDRPGLSKSGEGSRDHDGRETGKISDSEEEDEASERGIAAITDSDSGSEEAEAQDEQAQDLESSFSKLVKRLHQRIEGVRMKEIT